MKELLGSSDAALGLRRLAEEIVERHRGTEGLLLVGIRRGGVPLAELLAKLLLEQTGCVIPVGSVDISLYRDDASTSLPNPRIGPTQLPIAIEGRKVVLCDDVLFTGRTVRAAVDALLDYGRPAQIELAVLLDRGGRELPIQADYRVRQLLIPSHERVDVLSRGGAFSAVAVPQNSPTTPPPAVEDGALEQSTGEYGATGHSED